MTGHGEIAYGNAIGSVICNAALIAAITIAVRPGKVDPKSLRVPVLFFFVAAALYAGVAYTTGYFSRPIGIVLLAMFVAYMVCNVLAMKNAPPRKTMRTSRKRRCPLPRSSACSSSARP